MNASHRTVAALALLAVSTSCVAVAPGGGPARGALGAEVQMYPAGVIAGLHARTEVGAGEFITARIAANVTDRRDFGERDDEEGAGWGGGLGYRRYFDQTVTGREDSGSGWLWGARVDLWELEIDWIDGPGTPGETRGSTDVLVLQPTVEIGYGFDLSSGWRGEIVLAAGLEINLDEDGREVGEGPIGLIGFTLVPSF
ncbi:hypothetical protein Pla163_09230 [Planctomycetes bacterium Pla163]|uniref:Outer membrane protein beta-barrel domain-containing protein n=1 Tax=Rohdeia mirabilis TaxID=2528008 RepID=A0A518CX65_9BACT|nr:hypothetical protein Pla163_09230 [Planctomycetes bacterium Pla163]